jgi:hypothetical protein
MITWDPSRQVLWRKASGVYLCDHVSDFSITYFASSGEQLDPSTLTSVPALADVTYIRLRIVVALGSVQVTQVSDHMVGPR